MPDSRVTIKIPRGIYQRIQQITESSGFNSVTDFIVYVLRDVVSGAPTDGAWDGARGGSDGDPLRRAEIRAIRQRLKTLGYL